MNRTRIIAAGLIAAGLAACTTTHTVIIKPTVTHTVTAKPTPVKTTAKPKPTPKPTPVHTTPAPAPAAALPTVDTNNANNPGTQAIEPSFIGISEDGNGDLSGITWSSWTADSAEGSGSIDVNNGVPDMAQGTTANVPVSISLSDPVNGSFTAMTVTDSAGNTNTYGGNPLRSISDALSSADAPPAATPTRTPPVTVGGPDGFGSCGAQACVGPSVAPLPSPGWTPCTTIAGMYPGGEPGHINPSDGFCVIDGGTEG